MAAALLLVPIIALQTTGEISITGQLKALNPELLNPFTAADGLRSA